LRVEGLRGRARPAAKLAERLAQHAGIREVRASAITGNILILFDVRALDLRGLTGLVIREVTTRADDNPSISREAGDIAWQSLPVAAILQRLESEEAGLSMEQASRRLAQAGANRLPEPVPRRAFAIVADQLTSLPVLLLGGAAALSLVSGAAVDAVVILAVVGINAAIGYATERRVERILTSLRGTSGPSAVVRRERRELVLPAAALVPGDVIVLRAGHEVPADARLLSTEGLATDESTLTGESAPVTKAAALAVHELAPLAERSNMVFAGTLVAEGSALAVVTATGRHTEIGHIRALVAETAAPDTPLERGLDRIGRQLVGVSLGFCGLAFGLGLLRSIPALEMGRLAISLAVAAVPEGLPTVATTTLALGMRRMMARRTIVRRLAAVESLGATTVICADKTGTVTENRMTVDSWHLADRAYSASSLGVEAAADRDFARALTVAALCNEAELANGGSEIRGSSTEGALLRAAVQAGIDYRALRRRCPVLTTRPRNDGDSWMATVHADGAEGSRRLIAVKGAPEQVLRYATRRLVNGVEEPITDDVRRELLDTNARVAGRGMRVLGLACKEIDAQEEVSYRELVWLALVALTDPVREGVRDAIAACRTAGIRTVLVTGDQAPTAAAIARELGLAQQREVRVVEASTLAGLDGPALRTLAREVEVFARVSPADKYRIVRALQSSNDVVAMTGDGINDAAALRAAVIGVAMGERGTDVARDVADVVLLDDDFSAIVDAIAQGRAIRANVERSLRFLLATNFSEILMVLGALVVGGPRALSATQLLWVNLLSDVFPALALAVEPPEADVMQRPPRDPQQPILSNAALGGIAADAAILTAAALGVRQIALARYGPDLRTQTIGFSALTAAQLVHTLNCRAGTSPSGSPVTGVVVGSLALQVAAVTFPPLRALLGLTPLGLLDWALVGAAAVVPLLVGRTGRGALARLRAPALPPVEAPLR
jgi:Ca2+-transporting ATPase